MLPLHLSILVHPKTYQQLIMLPYHKSVVTQGSTEQAVRAWHSVHLHDNYCLKPTITGKQNVESLVARGSSWFTDQSMLILSPMVLNWSWPKGQDCAQKWPKWVSSAGRLCGPLEKLEKLSHSRGDRSRATAPSRWKESTERGPLDTALGRCSQHVPPAGVPEADPGHAIETMSLSWPGSNSEYSQEREVWESLIGLLPPSRPSPR